MKFKLNIGQPMIEQLRTMCGIVRDLNAIGYDITKEEQALNVIQALQILISGKVSHSLWPTASQIMKNLID